MTSFDLKRPPSADEALGMAWWNILKPSERVYWLTKAGHACNVANAWAAFKRHQAYPTNSSSQDTS
ncbi:hypothetical protein [Candidimonas nitroreducens]|nr:hypothetical protein [Candidimonas nitroreducens]